MNEQYYRELLSELVKLKTRKKLHDFLQAILTPKELKELPVRLQIVRMLKKGVNQREIARSLGVGLATVTRGSKELHKGNFRGVNVKSSK